jgi:hypothetical protein
MPKPGVVTIPTQIPVKATTGLTLEAGTPKVILRSPSDDGKTCVVCAGKVYLGDTVAIHGPSTIGAIETPEYFVPTAHRTKNAFQVRTTSAVTID